MQSNNISFKATLNVSDLLKYKNSFPKSHLNAVLPQLSKDFAIVTKDYPHYNLEANSLDINGKEVLFKLKVGEKPETMGFYDFWRNKENINIKNLIKIFKDLRSKAVYEKSLKYLQKWYSSKLPEIKNSTPGELDDLNALYAQKLKVITEVREKEQKLYKLEV